MTSRARGFVAPENLLRDCKTAAAVDDLPDMFDIRSEHGSDPGSERRQSESDDAWVEECSWCTDK